MKPPNTTPTRYPCGCGKWAIVRRSGVNSCQDCLDKAGRAKISSRQQLHGANHLPRARRVFNGEAL